MSNATELLRSLAMLEKRAGVMQDEPASSNVIYVDFGYAARMASRCKSSGRTPTMSEMISSTADLLS